MGDEDVGGFALSFHFEKAAFWGVWGDLFPVEAIVGVEMDAVGELAELMESY